MEELQVLWMVLIGEHWTILEMKKKVRWLKLNHFYWYREQSLTTKEICKQDFFLSKNI